MSNEVQLVVGAATDVGRERQVNEDAWGFVHCAAGDLLIVCDGMGGHANGQAASRTARDAIAAFVAGQGTTIHARELLRLAALEAHEAVRRVAAESPENTGMGTTCVMVLVQDRHAWVCNVGDSRAYLVRGGVLGQLSVDHTKARQLQALGLISEAQYDTHPEKGVLAQALGQKKVPEPFVSEAHPLGWEDCLVLCSDGVYDSTARDMVSLTAAKNPNYAAHDLVSQAVKRDGKDNATVVIGRVVDLNAGQSPAAVVGGAPWWQSPAARKGLAAVAGAGVVVGLILAALFSSEPEPPTASKGPGPTAPVRASSTRPTNEEPPRVPTDVVDHFADAPTSGRAAEPRKKSPPKSSGSAAGKSQQPKTDARAAGEKTGTTRSAPAASTDAGSSAMPDTRSGGD
jgi:serine/threonine protein phosphatase PrpC